MNSVWRKKWLLVMVSIIIVFVCIQFIKPVINNPPVTSEITLPDSIKQILRNACYDCHSNETKLSWFDKITPANWLVAHDIRGAREVLNFSEWDKLSKDRQRGILFESLNHVQFKTMPLWQYAFVHPKAKVDESGINLLKSYLSTLLIKELVDSGKVNNWHQQYYKWVHEKPLPRTVTLSPNGIAFMPGYKDWVAVSSTDRSDDGRLRVIMGNDIAVKAIKTDHTNPWPNGSVFAKIAWEQVSDSSGNAHTGEFKQVAFMIKDKERYKSTDGWGFAQWERGSELVPYGRNILFAQGCANCHKPMKENDFVFTVPLHLTIDQALEDKVICSFANKKQRTMATLYGNDIATGFARTHADSHYPAGSVLTLVTWKRKEDLHWFGADIPGVIQSIEKIRYDKTGDSGAMPLYEKYEGGFLKKIADNNLVNAKDRLNFIVGLRASVMP